VKFAHLADCHLDGWRDKKLRDVCNNSFVHAITVCIKENVDFVIIAGDLFNTALPNIETLKLAVQQLELLKQENIAVYIIPGSHDVTHAGKTMLDVLEEAKLVKNVVRGEVADETLKLLFTTDKKTGVKLTGMLGRRGMLEKQYYEHLDISSLEEESGEKIFLFHTAIDELKGVSVMDSSPLSLLPKGFLYYAGGHVHTVVAKSFPGYDHVVYPGPTFPNSFSELEELKEGGFYIYDDGKLKRITIPLRSVISLTVDANHQTPEYVFNIIKDALLEKQVDDVIITVRVAGKLMSGKTSDVDFTALTKFAYQRGAYAVLRNTVKFTSEEFVEYKKEYHSADEVEESFFIEHAGQIDIGVSVESEVSMAKKLLHALCTQKEDGEKVYHYEAKVKIQAKDVLGVH